MGYDDFNVERLRLHQRGLPAGGSWSGSGHDFTVFPTLDAAVAAAASELAERREDFARSLIRKRLPSLLHWIIDRPRLLRFILKLRPGWTPVWAWVQLGSTTDDSAGQMARAWSAEMRARDLPIPDALVFSYSGPDGMPRELHGVPTLNAEAASTRSSQVV